MLSAILFFPLIGFLINSGLIAATRGKVSSTISGAIASAAVFGAFVCAVSSFIDLTHLSPEARFLESTLFQWMTAGDFDLPFTLRLDPLNSLLTLIITGVGFLIHLYSIGYMSHDAHPGKFFAYLNLFCFAMLALVMGASLPILFLGWEGVGLCSYLLIGFWYEDPDKAAAGMKAFVVNRIGDLGFLAGMFFIYTMFKTLDFVQLKALVLSQSQAGTLDLTVLTIATLCLFVGAMGKSAQIPLYVWLPDAMAGPTPVSALIHAATMVTAGVYMICRLNFMYSLCPTTLMVVSGVGAFTALFSATIAITQRDIKKVLAYSTVSQLGYMFVAAGVGAYVAAVFHLMTHAFFKALLFLGSGSVIHGMHEEQDIMKMGGLKKYMPQTFATFLIGTVAIAGIPPLAGFWSKDEILFMAFTSHMGLAGPILWGICALTAFLTAFYMTRVTCLTFFGKPRFKEDDHHHAPHESPAIMIIPLVVLAVLSIFGGFLGIPHYSVLEHWLEPVMGAHQSEASASVEFGLMGFSTAVAVLSCFLAYNLYVNKTKLAEELQKRFSFVHKLLFNKYYIDELYSAVFIEPLKKLCVWCWKYIDVIFVDGVVLGVGKVSRFSGEILRLVHTGSIQVYIAFMLFGLVILMGYLGYGFFSGIL